MDDGRANATWTKFVGVATIVCGTIVLTAADASFGGETLYNGIVLPDQAEIPTITGRVVEISAQIEHDDDFPVRKYDKVLFHPKNAIPVDLESDNVLFVVDIDDVVAVFRRTSVGDTAPESVEDVDDLDLDL